MKLILPDYYEDFQCLAAACKNSCCIGWALEIDEATLAHYQTIPGPFGDVLRAELARGTTDETDGICTLSLTVDGRCPFLDDENLCQIIRALGPAALPEICSEYPRTYFTYGDTIERTLLPSCEEAARLLFSRETMPTLITREVAGDMQDPLTAEEEAMKATVLQARDAAFAVLAKEELSLDEKLSAIFPAELLPADPDDYDAFLTRLDILSQLEVLNDDWAACMRDLEGSFDNEHSYHQALGVLASAAPQRDHDVALFLHYLIFRNYSPAIYDGRLRERMRYCIFCLQLLRDIDALLAQKNSGRFSQSDRIRSVSLFSREIEHSDVNPDIILDELMFS